MPSGSRDLSHLVVGSVQAQMGLPVTPFPVFTSPNSLVVGVSPTVGVTKPFIQEPNTPTMSKAPHLVLVAQGNTGGGGFQGEVSLTPSEEAGTACQLASLTVKSSVGQTELICCPALTSMTSVELRCPMSDGFHGGDSPATLGRADLTHRHWVSQVEVSCCPAMTSVEL